jgi:3-hydroxyacyl-[acyl-carrier-protein] dehydratase
LNVILKFIDDYQTETGVDLDDLHELKAAICSPEGVQRVRQSNENLMGFLASQDLKFRGVVYPGDVLEITCEMFLVDSSGFNHFNVEARVGKKIVCSGRMSNWRQHTSGFGIPEDKLSKEESN